MVWCGLWGNKVIGPYFFPLTVTSDSYVNVLEQMWATHHQEILVGNPWFQQGSAPAHSSRGVITWLTDHFPNKWIGRKGPIEWPPRSPDLTPLDFFFWGYVKAIVYDDPPSNLLMLQQRIINACQFLPVNLLAQVYKEWQHRLTYTIAANGQLFEHLL